MTTFYPDTQITAPSGNQNYENFAREGYEVLHGAWVIEDPSITDPQHREYMNVTFSIDERHASPRSTMQVYVPQRPGILELSDPGHENAPVTRGSAIARMVLNAIEIARYVGQSGQRYAQSDLQLIGIGGRIYPYATDGYGQGSPGRHRLAQRRREFWNHDSRVQNFLQDRDFFSDAGREGRAWWIVGAFMIYTQGGWVYATLKHRYYPSNQLEMYLLPVGQDQRQGPFRLNRR